MAELFDVINCMFSKPAEFKKLSMNERGKHFFMIQRFMSIKYPIQASFMNHTKINPAQVVTYWQESIGKMYSKTPTWMYAKVNKKKAAKDGVIFEESTLNYYCRKKQISRKVLDDAIKYVGDPMIKELKEIEKMIKNS